MSKSTSGAESPSSQLILSSAERKVVAAAWSISAITSLVAIYAWGNTYGWHLSFNPYQVFPLMGLLAFSLMWSHYMAGFIRSYTGIKRPILKSYFSNTSTVVLALLLLHPAIVIFQRYRDGYGFPPHSYESYVAPGLGWVTLLGTISWFIFIAFEFRHKYGHYSWWKYVPMAGDVAMLAIVYHGLRIGDQLQTGWFRGVWVGYGIALSFVLIYNYYQKYQKRQARLASA
jgi:hypothetical protein